MKLLRLSGSLCGVLHHKHTLHKGKMARSTMIFGCGNALMGDDGFGPAVIEHLGRTDLLPASVQVIDAGTGVREYLFDYLLLAEGRPETVIIVDGVDFPDRQPGELIRIAPADIPARKIHDFSLHQFPTVNLLQELELHAGVRVVVLAVQVGFIPDRIAPGLTAPVAEAVDRACEEIMQILCNECPVR